MYLEALLFSAKIDLGLHIILPFKEQLKIWIVEAEEWAGAASMAGKTVQLLLKDGGDGPSLPDVLKQNRAVWRARKHLRFEANRL